MPEEKGIGMGLEDVLFPPLIPLKGLMWIGEKIKDIAERELTDESKVHEELLELQMRFEMGEITEEAYEKKEAELMERLEAIRRYMEER
ncbi:hypothetical protein HKBW3S03_00435 [Candidatus Hakubella thermalkaliphila]|uniref:Gas vesicle protein GvpG n=1 Tax=Candidatus Hakubella thermalkaliphila TaxID=2754717 RepID=A0A6V8NI06_9ACTN|nr:gas vesicle protein GvpG [Candidatus Hakubella thermalkaliphila]MBT9169749.1 hypothetical protein [Actinomycetota bacterium]GFP18930.1 hypothetical protein HKBW3S03_00435 [Candidatus Hakubella thermalkaliphila]GFP22727.1 hypothetical protein HKBW3S09_00195 [Candidatus Hakubella thermalkaliphila]GFP36618.1 hypothetical protein HKBW3S44_00299 [Candidatus Hakubella thermalkaliphila]GFP39018.1 hypothetical protein HKBW3S47_00718 [Candidatus Hakubella thermalkaliphila]